MPCDLFSLSPKLANSTPWKRAAGKFAPRHEALRLNFSVIQSYVENYDYQLKFVVAQRDDFDEIERILAALKKVDRSRVLIMPEGTTRRALTAKAKWWSSSASRTATAIRRACTSNYSATAAAPDR